MVNDMNKSSNNMASQNAELLDIINELKDTVQTLRVTVNDLKNENALLVEENKYLKRKLFGRKTEKSSALGFEQLSFFDEVENTCDEELTEEITYTRSKKRHKGEKKLKLENLEQVEEVYTLDEEQQVCKRCGSRMYKVGKEYVRSEVEFIPAKLVVKNYYRETYECRNCKKDNLKVMYKAPTPLPVIPHSYASPTAIAHIMKEKFINGVPLYRQEAEWKHLGLELSRATMSNWLLIASTDYLIPLKKRMQEILTKESHIHADETPVQVLNEQGKDNASKSYMWVYASIKESKTPIKLFEYSPTRKAENVEKYLKDFNGTIITDAYQAYKKLKGVKNAYCWAHVRRKFRDALPDDIKNREETLPKQAMDKIAKLFAIEKKIKDKSPTEKVMIRQQEAKPLLEEFFLWCEKNQNKVLPKSKLGKAFLYALNQREGLMEYIDDGLIPMTNSLDERTIRPFAIGRKNWLFCGSPRGAEASATIYSIIETAKANHIDPYDYIDFLLEYLPNKDIENHPERLDDYLPWGKITKQIFEIEA